MCRDVHYWIDAKQAESIIRDLREALQGVNVGGPSQPTLANK